MRISVRLPKQLIQNNSDKFYYNCNAYKSRIDMTKWKKWMFHFKIQGEASKIKVKLMSTSYFLTTV